MNAHPPAPRVPKPHAAAAAPAAPGGAPPASPPTDPRRLSAASMSAEGVAAHGLENAEADADEATMRTRTVSLKKKRKPSAGQINVSV